MISQHQAIDVVTQLVFFSSLAHTFLPPWDVLNDFPKAQKYYKVLVYVVGYTALNGRSTVYHGISTQNGQQPSPLVKESKQDNGNAL